jgi:hypothetical protein
VLPASLSGYRGIKNIVTLVSLSVCPLALRQSRRRRIADDTGFTLYG